MHIAFIGLGIMGKPMARNLRRAGHDMVVYNRSRPAMDELVRDGMTAAANPADAAARADIVVTMLPNSPEVRDVVTGDNGVLSGARNGLVPIDMSSIAPLAAREIAALCGEKGVTMLDAPVSGGEPKAIDGTLAVMAGGDRDTFDRLREPVLLKMAASAVYCGPIGAGNAAKLANQIIVAANIAAVAEALTLAGQIGVDPAVVVDAIRGGLAGSAVLEAKAPMMIRDDFTPGFKIDLHIKDLANALETRYGVGSPMPITAQIAEMLQTVRADGGGQCDHSALITYFRKLTGTGGGR
ncbi:MAG: 2-hydroxy-3-oxopropionate reductase [Planctomycetes bacterium]|nr:2-hydroxy-3-oxopropionate reductase [Planctomycetota bacterium]MCC8115618.1 2-hydroxy-3-oxopropionate reductase [Planctomycetota bacterium]